MTKERIMLNYIGMYEKICAKGNIKKSKEGVSKAVSTPRERKSSAGSFHVFNICLNFPTGAAVVNCIRRHKKNV